MDVYTPILSFNITVQQYPRLTIIDLQVNLIFEGAEYIVFLIVGSNYLYG